MKVLFSASEVFPLIKTGGLADVAYTMYWNSSAFALRLEEAFERVCDNNLDKFVALDGWSRGEAVLDRTEWHCDRQVEWPGYPCGRLHGDGERKGLAGIDGGQVGAERDAGCRSLFRVILPVSTVRASAHAEVSRGSLRLPRAGEKTAGER